MKKLVVLAVLLSMSTGCGRGWFPHLFRGAPCNGTCAQPVNHSCEGCAGYGSYDGAITDGSYVDGGVVGTGPVYQTLPQPTLPLTQPGIVAPQ